MPPAGCDLLTSAPTQNYDAARHNNIIVAATQVLSGIHEKNAESTFS